ncbi:hydrogenase formation protein HypD (plasmid) [Lichenicola cladoniae]|uniref:Hydrogenase maturation factor n=1 Tax=Lichenicola cladoniae TaxID=1484109 RepID=A0A6M8HYC3_9PROT|nr:hydrogenase formation protein HypD [Lichenicola cladoniae]NPD68191.1 hydrogenase formation protein HypD [Acetobacteraceae bacterium]QKE93559.1 hydrogenase formation protein HypD [Lichenicola cladoniae]
MKYIDEYRDGTLARAIATTIASEAVPGRHYQFMEFCGGHTHAVSRYGIEDLLPSNVRMVHGPGCPVCVLPVGRIDDAIALALRPGVTLCTYADLMRVPASGGGSLLKARSAGADIRMVYSTMDAIRIAEDEPGRDVVFFAIGFETTTPATAIAIRLARRKMLRNFSVFCNHVLTPPAIRAVLDVPDDDNADEHTGGVRIDGFVGPAHVSTVIGTTPYVALAKHFRKPVVVAGFEPLDMMQAILMLVRQINDGRHDVENQYIRMVSEAGNLIAQRAIAEVFELRASFEWRGLGELPDSALQLREAYADLDAERRFSITTVSTADNPACECGDVLRGRTKPAECKLFGTVCSPETPMGSCMVSPEGACAAHWAYGRFRNRVARQPVPAAT